MITPHLESLRQGLPELQPLLPRHYEELSLHKLHDHPLAPQYDVYLAREDQGQLMYMTLRANGELVGYYIGFIAPGLHYKSCLTAHADIFYVVPEVRGGGSGDILFDAVEKEIRRRRCSLWQAGEKIHLSQFTSALFRKHGLEPAETIYHKWLE
jgi:GNAT superfamily N-acetyltransferase